MGGPVISGMCCSMTGINVTGIRVEIRWLSLTTPEHLLVFTVV